ncbi:MAG TPA: DMT family transporter [Candidatus Limnocylindria bacterium]|nr:DMT family transporter [Candidatus Limnocylindria bacterium]
MTVPTTAARRRAAGRSVLPSAVRGLAQRPVAAAVLGALVIAFSAIFVALADVTPATAAIFRCVYALPALALLAWWEERRYGPRAAGQRRLAIVAGLFFAADLVLWHHAIGAVGAGLATVLGNTQVVMVGVAAWLLLGERPDRRVLLSVPVVFVGIVFISGVIGADAYGRDPLLGSIFGVLTGVAYTGFLLLQRRANADRRRPAGPLFDATLAAAIASAAIGLPLGELQLVPSWPAHGWLLLLGLLVQVVGWLLISVSLPRLPSAVTSVVLTVQPVGSVVLGMVLLGEDPSGLQLVGVALVLAGLFITTLRRRSERTGEPELG